MAIAKLQDSRQDRELEPFSALLIAEALRELDAEKKRLHRPSA
ncbi:hypothetical protein [Rhodopseudomonas palustris]|nr:hypothetical protein [Rhodopseudomonas palustris]